MYCLIAKITFIFAGFDFAVSCGNERFWWFLLVVYLGAGRGLPNYRQEVTRTARSRQEQKIADKKQSFVIFVLQMLFKQHVICMSNFRDSKIEL